MDSREMVRPFVIVLTACVLVGVLFLLANESIGVAPSGSPAALAAWFLILVASHLLLIGLDGTQIADMIPGIRILGSLLIASVAVLQLDLIPLGRLLGLPPQHFLAGTVLAMVIGWMLHAARVDMRRLSAA